MEIILICDGPLPLDSPVRKLPFFFSARLIDMARVSPRTVGDASVAIVELLDASEAGLRALKAAWASIAEIPVICLVSKSNRREAIQAAALGKSEVMDRDTPFALLLKRIRSHLQTDVAAALPAGTPANVVKAFSNANAFLEDMCLAVVTETGLKAKGMEQNAAEMLSVLDFNGLGDWLDAVQYHHSPTYGHSLRVAGLAGAFARHLEWPEADCRTVIAGGLVHDIGKMRIPLTILDKQGALNEEERALIGRHPVFGQEILKPCLEVSIDIKKMAIQHHELLDGSGYPKGLKGDRISPLVRLMTICDIFAALTEERAYKDAYSDREALIAMREMGPKLDQVLLRKFTSLILGSSLGEVQRPHTDAAAS